MRTIGLSIAIVLAVAWTVRAQEIVKLEPLPLIDVREMPVVYGQGRQLGVHVSDPGEIGSSPRRMNFFSPFEPPPPTPDQRDVLLNQNDLLTIAAPNFAFPGMLGAFDAVFGRDGTDLFLDGYSLLSGGMTHTLYGPAEYLHPIGALPAGTYTLHTRHFLIFDSRMLSFEEYRADPQAYALGHNLQLTIVHQTLNFAVVPEPAGLTLVVVTMSLLMLRRGAGDRPPVRPRSDSLVC